MAVRKTTLTIDDELIAEAQRVLGTSGIRDTVDAALAEILRGDAAARHLERLRTMDGIDLDDPEVMAGAWRR